MDPKMGFVIMKDDDLADTRRRSLDLLYQPLLQTTGYALINILWRLSEFRSNTLYQRPIGELLTYMNVDVQVFTKALHKVEGAGLIKVFKEIKQGHKFYIFHLIQPRSAREFFKDDLLSVGLLEMVGDRYFRRLSQILIPKHDTFKDAQDMTHNFLEVYVVDHKHLTHLPELIKRVRAGMHTKMQSSLEGDHQFIDESPDFNFDLLMNIIKHNSFANPKEVKAHKHLILTEHAIYGLDEKAMAGYISDAASFVNNKVDFNKFRLLVAKTFQGNHRKPIKTHYTPVSALRQSTKTKNSQTPLHQDEQLLIKAADHYAPIQFLYDLKKKMNPNGIVTNREERTVEQAISYAAFRDNRGVLNILIYYMIWQLKMPTLKPNFMQYMISAWNQAKISTPAEALAEIRQHQQKRSQRWLKYKTRRSQNKFSYGKQPRIKQKLPKWARSDYHVKLHPASPEAVRKAEQYVKKLNQRSKSKKGGRK